MSSPQARKAFPKPAQAADPRRMIPEADPVEPAPEPGSVEDRLAALEAKLAALEERIPDE